MEKYQDRKQAGQILAQHLLQYQNQPDIVVLGLPRGGVPVAYELAKILNLPLQVFIVRKIGMPGHEEFAIGAVASGDIVYLDKSLIDRFHVKDATVQSILYRKKQELRRREKSTRSLIPIKRVSRRNKNNRLLRIHCKNRI